MVRGVVAFVRVACKGGSAALSELGDNQFLLGTKSFPVSDPGIIRGIQAGYSGDPPTLNKWSKILLEKE